MSWIVCPVCRGAGEVEYDCRDCNGCGYDPTEDNTFGQCHTCYGEGTADQVCLECIGAGVIHQEDEDSDDTKPDSDENEV